LGLAAATAISGFINAYVMLKMSKIKLFATKRAFADFVKIIVASIAMFAVMYTLDTSLHFGYSRTVNEVLSIVIELFAGIVVYALSLVLLRDGAARNILQMIKNKK
jgi:peptidoglycan biosynthesis protein MviN/MurJ (putative lipid II flippase)